MRQEFRCWADVADDGFRTNSGHYNIPRLFHSEAAATCNAKVAAVQVRVIVEAVEPSKYIDFAPQPRDATYWRRMYEELKEVR